MARKNWHQVDHETMAKYSQDGYLISNQQLSAQLAGLGVARRQLPWLATQLGDSITQGDGGWTNNSNFTVASNSCFEWMCILSGGRIVRLRNAGVASQTSAQIAARFASDVPSTTTLGLVQAGTNDLGGVLTQAQTVANVTSIAQGYMSMGARTVIVAIPPKNTAPAAVSSLNRALASVAKTIGCEFINPWTRVSAGDGTYVSGMSSDGTHPTMAASYVAAQDALLQLFGYSPIAEIPFILPTENADPLGALYAGTTLNSCFMTDSNADGTPDGWTAASGVTNTLVTATYPAVGKTLTMTASGITAAKTIQRSTSQPLVAGARYLAVCRVASSGCEAGGLKFKVGYQDSGASVNFINTVSKDFSGLFVVPFTAPVTPSTGYFQVVLQPVSASGSGVVSLSQAEIYKASDLGMSV